MKDRKTSKDEKKEHKDILVIVRDGQVKPKSIHIKDFYLFFINV